jgi:hypothetical protein
MQTEEWARRIERTGAEPVAVLLLEVIRALGFVAAQALLLGQPLLTGLMDDATIRKAASWLEDPGQAEQLLKRLEREEDGP